MCFRKVETVRKFPYLNQDAIHAFESKLYQILSTYNLGLKNTVLSKKIDQKRLLRSRKKYLNLAIIAKNSEHLKIRSGNIV